MGYQTLTVERKEKGVCLITILNPPANALSEALTSDLDALMDELESSDDRVVVIASANPKIFVAGADLSAMAGNAGSLGQKGAIAAMSQRMQKTFDRLAKLEKPVIAAVIPL